MDRISRVIKYLERYHHLCYIKESRSDSALQKEKLKSEMKAVKSLIKELQEHGC